MYTVNMAKISEKTKPGWAIPTTVKENFVDFCAQIGAIAQEDFAGALFLWQRMPAQIREWAKLEAKGYPSLVPPDYWNGLSDGIEVSSQALLENLKRRKTKKSSKSL